jgi:hypothetical protein
MFRSKALVLIFSPTSRQSVELFLKIRVAYRDLTGQQGRWYQERQTGNALELKNGSRIVALPGKEANIRGFSGVTLLIIDEASRVPDVLCEKICICSICGPINQWVLYIYITGRFCNKKGLCY